MVPQNLQAAYVLHTRRYGDSSLIADLFTREQGRVACIAKGALRARRPSIRIQSFQPLLVELRGRGEVLTLVHAEPEAATLHIRGRYIYCGLYLNELLLKLTARQDTCPALFDDYALAIEGLSMAMSVEPVLRRFEVRLLYHLGLGLALEVDSNGQPIVPDSSYNYTVDSGASLVSGDQPDALSGKTLLSLQSGIFDDEACLREARWLMRRILDRHLDGRPLRSRELFR